MDTSESASTGEKGHGREMDIKPDTFFGKSNTESAEKYLKMLGHAAPVDSILEALKKGGAQFKGDGKHTLYVQLIRATSKFVKIGKGPDSTIGLREWYSKIPKPKPDNIPKKKVVIKKVKPKEAKEVKLDSESE